jgi:hypothetical protein
MVKDFWEIVKNSATEKKNILQHSQMYKENVIITLVNQFKKES